MKTMVSMLSLKDAVIDALNDELKGKEQILQAYEVISVESAVKNICYSCSP